MSSSDEAPEEVTFDEAKFSTRLVEKRQRQQEQEQLKLDKQKRRERDQRLKAQHVPQKRKLLSDILKEEAEDSESSDEDEEMSSTAIESISTKNRTKKKTFDDVDGFRIQVVDKPQTTKKKRLPPAGTDAVERRNQFLFRESVPRR